MQLVTAKPAPPRTLPAARRVDRGAVLSELEAHRQDLRAFCARELGSAFEADDAVQEAMLRAWRNVDRFEGRASLRTWLRRIARNVCIDMLRARRPTAGIDPEVAETAGAVVGSPTARPVPPASVVAGPVTDAGPGARGGDPADVAVARDDLRRALAAAIHLLPPRQRAVLILADVLHWKAGEVAELLGTTVVSVNSARQRARSRLAARAHAVSGPVGDGELLGQLAAAFERSDVASLVALVHPQGTGV